MNGPEDQNISNWIRESAVWTSDVDFWLDETQSFQSVLVEALKTVYEPSFLKQLNHLQNIVTYYGSEVLIELKSKIFHHMERLRTLKNEELHNEKSLLGKEHTQLGKEIEGIEKLMREYKDEFSILKQQIAVQSRVASEKISHILVPSDFSENANRAIDYALSIFGKGVTNITLLHISPSGAEEGADVNAEYEVGLQLEQEVERIYKGFPDVASKLNTISKTGDLSHWINETCLNEDVDIIIMGTLGSGGFVKDIYGSNTSKVIDNVMTPVLVIPSETPLLPPKRIAFTTDLVHTQRPSGMELLKNICEIYSADLRVIHVEPMGQKIESIHDKLHIRDSMETLGLSEKKLEILESEDIIVGINDFIKENYIDLLTVVTHHGGLFYSLFSKSVSRHMVLHSHTPILVLHSTLS